MDTRFHVVVSGRNTAAFAEACLTSILDQDYGNFRVTWIDDDSDDDSAGEAYILKQDHRAAHGPAATNLTIRENTCREGALYNYIWRGAAMSDDDEVVVCVDGDDYLRHDGVLRRLDEEYQKGAWVVYAAFERTDDGPLFGSGEYASLAVTVGGKEERCWFPPVREAPCQIAGLRSFRASLARKIHDEDLQIGGWWQQTAWDNALMLPMLEMAGPERVRYISETLYVYRMHEGNDARQSAHYQAFCEWFSRARPSYSRLASLTDVPERTPRKPANEGMLFVAGLPHPMGVKLR